MDSKIVNSNDHSEWLNSIYEYSQQEESICSTTPSFWNKNLTAIYFKADYMHLEKFYPAIKIDDLVK